MKNTEKLISKIREILNTNPKIQSIMDMLIEKANNIGMSAKQFEEFKTQMLTNLVFKMAIDYPDLRVKEQLGEDIWNELRKAN